MSVTYTPDQPRTSELLARQLGQSAGQGIQKALSDFNVKKQNRNALAGLQPLFKQAGIEFSPEEQEQFLGSGLNPEVAGKFAVDIAKQRASEREAGQKAFADRQKQLFEQQEKQREEQGFQNVFDELEELFAYGGMDFPGMKSGTIWGLNREAVEKREELDKLGFWVADKVYTHFNKGTVTDKKFNEIKKELAPNSKLSERKNRGRMRALQLISNLPSNINQKAFDKFVDKQIAEVNKIPGNAPGAENAPGTKRISLEEIFG